MSKIHVIVVMSLLLLQLAKTMAGNLDKARITCKELKLSLKESEGAMRARHGSDVVEKWKNTPLEPVRISKKKVESPFRSNTPGMCTSKLQGRI